MIAHGPTPLQQQHGWLPPDGELPAASPAEVAAARRLGLVLSVAVAVGVDIVVSMLHPEKSPFDATGGIVLHGRGIVTILAAAPFGWLLGPAAARARPAGGAAIVIAMAVGVMILGDILTVIGIALGSLIESGASYPSGDIAAGLVTISLIGATVVGPFVVALLTLPAAIAWIVAFRVAWVAVRPDRLD